MSKELIHRQTNLPAEVRAEVQLFRASPERYYGIVRKEGIEDEREPGAITIFHLNKNMERREALLAISIAILEVKEWFNVKGTMTDRQVSMTAEMILDHPQFYDLSIGNIKACFRQRMMTEKLYDRLDGNIIIGWLREFKSEMADATYRQRCEKDRMEKIKEEKSGDDGALNKRALDLLKNLPSAKKHRTKEEQEQWKRDFLRYKAEYIINKKNGN